MKRMIIAGLAAAGLFAFSTTDANAQYYYGGYPSYSYPGYSFSFSYSDRDYHRYRGPIRGYSHSRWGGHSHSDHHRGYGHSHSDHHRGRGHGHWRHH